MELQGILQHLNAAVADHIGNSDEELLAAPAAGQARCRATFEGRTGGQEVVRSYASKTVQEDRGPRCSKRLVPLGIPNVRFESPADTAKPLCT
jgi:hypothetical protein